MPVTVLMPALSPTMEKGNLAKWLKKEGDTVKSGDILAEIETDKATMEVEAIDEGILAKIVVPEGTADVAVNAPIAFIASEGEDVKAVAAGASADASTSASSSAAPAKPEPVQGVPVATSAVPASSSPPSASSSPEKQTVQTEAQDTNSGRVFASPLARRLALQSGIDLSHVVGSGPRGRIVAADIETAGTVAPQKAAASSVSKNVTPAPVSHTAAQGMSDETIKKLFTPGSFEEVPHDGMRKTIARRLLESKQTVPHFYLSADCNLDALLTLREQINGAAGQGGDGKPAYKISVNDLVIKALALALKAVPEANVTWTDGAMLKHKAIDVGVAVSIPGGLITPVIRDAAQKPLSVISNEMKDLAARAKARKLKPEEYQGGTTAVSNLGMFGISNFSAIINPPHATILAVGAGEKRAIVKGDQLVIASVMTVTLSTDHRAVDGALGAELMAAFRGFIEKPLGMLV